ncbi:Transcription elongation factor 1 [Neolecta irregularis DAH-3]|uniref:Transcription elongation factor 1 homolog n=1 Tax=Neolecta irregularis (strain DAH-3) TaxID=1198029 RepID=A0A1U7LLK8_NEOID|nr:Transcription elongation factor 1 [Neolecta irregularis DAH-3]|eukprot:OLL23473.1 Transcription elongation factor 1 [Neolecta irregularis DAH-3]
MGKRSKKTKPAGPKKREKLDKQFTCIICNHEGSVS